MNNSGSLYNAVTISHNQDHLHETFHVSIDSHVDLFLSIGFSNILDEALCRNTIYSVVQLMQQEFFAAKGGMIFETMERALKEVNSYLAKRNLHEIGLIHAAVALKIGKTLHITKTGLGEVYLVRRKMVTNVTADFDETYIDDGKNEPTVEDMMRSGQKDFFSNIASGELEEGDIVLVSSFRLSRFIDENLLSAFFSKGGLDVGILNVEHRLKEDADSDIAIIGFKLQEADINPQKKAPVIKEPHGQPMHEGSSNRPQSILERYHAKEKASAYAEKAKKFGNDVFSKNLTMFQDSNSRRKVFGFAFVVIIVLLIFSIVSNLSGGQGGALKKEFETQFVQARNELSLAKNENIKGDTLKAGEHLDAAKKIAEDLKSKNIATADVATLLEDIAREDDSTNKITRVKPTDTFIDLAGKLSGEVPKGVVELREKLYLYTASSIYGPFISNATDAGQKFKLDTNDLILDVIPFDDVNGLLIKLTPDRVAEFINNAFSFSDTTGVAWKSGAKIGTFRSNVYVLGNDQIWRYTKNRNSYRGPDPWLKSNDTTLANAVAFGIDGSMFALMKDGKIVNYFRGKKSTTFNVMDAPKAFSESYDERSQIITRPDWNKVYVFAHGQKKLGVFTKVPAKDAISFDKQFDFGDMDIIGVTISENQSMLYAIGSDLKVYRVGL